ncbi:MAG: acyl carrier protein [Bacteroidales bacterium]|jgi:acyl carrier protein|nr:acyl carrier protein [Bacteroidales bacterium]MBR4487394.1 acyl carrier protein [Bacteroidales bacterium]
MEELIEEVKEIIAEKLSVDKEDITLEKSFTADLGADSLDTVELIMEFEKKFNITIPDEVSETIHTVGDAVEYIKNNRK